MRALAQRKTRLVFDTDDSIYERGHSRQVVVEARPSYAMVRLKGTRKGYPICYAAMYHAAVRLAVEAERAVKARERKAAKR
jgi:hypothetical protein